MLVGVSGAALAEGKGGLAWMPSCYICCASCHSIASGNGLTGCCADANDARPLARRQPGGGQQLLPGSAQTASRHIPAQWGVTVESLRCEADLREPALHACTHVSPAVCMHVMCSTAWRAHPPGPAAGGQRARGAAADQRMHLLRGCCCG